MLKKSALIFLIVLLAGCTGKDYLKDAESLPEGYSMILTRTYAEEFRKKNWICDAGPRRITLWANFERYKPSLPKTTFFLFGKGPSGCEVEHSGHVRTYKVRPGKYRFTDAETKGFIVTMDHEHQQFVFEVKKGEALYIGDVIMAISGGHFKMEARKNPAEVMEVFEKKFKSTGLKFTTRLARNARFIVPRLPK